MSATECAPRLKARAAALGFDSCRIGNADLTSETGARLREFVELGYHGEMDWIANSVERRCSPVHMWPAARCVIMLGMSYRPSIHPIERITDRTLGNISVYALGRDYHNVIKGKLKQLAQWLIQETKAEAKVFVDTAPLMEKPLAMAAGVGWQGKHTNLVSRELGSWFFIGAILTSAELATDTSETDHCGTCSACLDICPTQAFPQPYALDARRCISYLTIEHKGHIAFEFRKPMGNRIFGCDDCLAVCPWNKFAVEAREVKLKARNDLSNVRIGDLLLIDDRTFRLLFSGSPIKRTGRDRFVRNVLIAAANSGDALLKPAVKSLLTDPSPLVRAMAVWALAQIDIDEFASAKNEFESAETDGAVQQEWQRAFP